MTKRPSTPASPPPPKRRERPSTSSLSHAQTEQIPSSQHPTLPLDDTALAGLREFFDFLRDKVTSDGVTEATFKCYTTVYEEVHDISEKLNWDRKIVDKNGFLKNVEQQRRHFFTALKRAVAVDSSLADIDAFLSHGTCFYNQVNRSSMYVPKVCFGQRGHPSPLVSSQTHRLKIDC